MASAPSMENVYSQEIVLPCYDVDSRCRLKPASFMNMAQEAAQRHAEILGFGYDDLIAKRAAWVLSRIHIRFLRYPLWRDKVTLSTWHKGAEGLFYLRDFEMRDSGGEVLVAAASSWLVLNVDSRRLWRESGVTDNGTSCDRNALEHSCGRIRIPTGAPERLVGERHVAFSDIDMNRHANNVSYLVWIMDTLDFDFAENCPLKELAFNFISEIHPGQTVLLFRHESDGKVFFEGRTDGKPAFASEMTFGERL